MDVDPRGHAMAAGNFHFRGVDRYDALGRSPNGCRGQCEGTGWVPVSPSFKPLWDAKDDESRALQEAWHRAEAEKSTQGQRDRTHFVRCPLCNVDENARRPSA